MRCAAGLFAVVFVYAVVLVGFAAAAGQSIVDAAVAVVVAAE